MTDKTQHHVTFASAILLAFFVGLTHSPVLHLFLELRLPALWWRCLRRKGCAKRQSGQSHKNTGNKNSFYRHANSFR